MHYDRASHAAPFYLMANFVNILTGRDPSAYRPGQSAPAVSIGWPLIFIGTLLFLPSATYYRLGTSSDTPGLVAACLLLWGAALATGRFEAGGFARYAIGIGPLIACVLIAHLAIAVFLPYVPQVVDLTRTSVSLVAFIIVAVGAAIAADWLLQASSVQVDRIGAVIRVLLVLIGLWSFLGWQPASPLELSRPSFPFSEPSHYALVAAPFIIDGCVRATKSQRLLWLAVWLAIGLLDRSLSLVVVIAIAAVVSLPILYAIVAAVPVAVVGAGMDLQYYTDRLDFSVTSTNLSALIYRQGWELIHQGITYSHGWGIGFQQLGFAPLNSPISDVIYRILGSDSNLRDGSFLAAKLISELGVFGMAIVAACVVTMIRSAVRLRRLAALPGAAQPGQLRFALAMICAFATEMFVRDIGYFSNTVVLFVASIMVVRTLLKRGIPSNPL